MLEFFRTKKKNSTKEKIATSQKLLSDFLNLCPEQKLEKYEQYLVPAIANLYSVICKNDKLEYEEMDLLYADYVLSDVGLIMFFSRNFKKEYVKSIVAINLQYPKDDYEIVNGTVGLCRDKETGKNFYNARISVDNSITSTALYWSKKIPEIIKLF